MPLDNTISFSDAIKTKYASYALSTITSRSLPDLRDGLKPVHRRILYAMLLLKLDPEAAFKKCSRVVGDVIGKYHPHGDTSVYDALVRMAQSFASRYPLVEGQGNFGSIDGDAQAAMRYTESKLTKYAKLLLDGIGEDTVDFRNNYDDSDTEPSVLPAAVANILLNGTEGIAVGMATSIPPHNLIEINNACIELLKHPSTDIDSLIDQEIIKGPDFPTGGILYESKEKIREIYKIAKGSIRLRAKWAREDLERSCYQIVITEIPYHVQKQSLIEKMAELYNAKKIPYIESFQDLSAEDIRIIITPKSRNIEPEMIMESLFKLTDLEARLQINMNVITKEQKPACMNIKEILVHFLAHRQEVVTRHLKYKLEKIENRLEVLRGFLIAYLNLDQLIQIIREEDEPKAIIIKKWNLSELQAEAILNMRLRSLRKLEEMKITQETEELSTEGDKIKAILSDPKKLSNILVKQFKDINTSFAKDEVSNRRTHITEGEVKDSQQKAQFEQQMLLVEKENIIIICSQMGWLRAIKSTPQFDKKTIKYKEGDTHGFVLNASTIDKIVLFSNYGNFYTMECSKLPKSKTAGEQIKGILALQDDETIIAIYKYAPDHKFLIASREGKGFIVKSEDIIAHKKSGKKILLSGDAICCAQIHQNQNMIAILGNNRKLLVYDLAQIPEMKKGSGVKLQNYKNGASLAGIMPFDSEGGLMWKSGSKTFMLKNIELFIGKRGSAGRLSLKKLWL